MRQKYLNSQKYNECQLVALINALIYHGKPAVDQDSMEYERLVDYVVARHDGAQYIGRAAEYLQLEIGYDDFSLTNIKKYLRRGIPVATSVKDAKYDYHTILIVDYREKEETYLRIPNWEDTQWVPWKHLKRMVLRHHSYELGIIDSRRPRKLIHTVKSL